MAKSLSKAELNLVRKYQGAIFGHGILCHFCKWQLTNHIHGVEDGEDASTKREGASFLLDECPGYVPEDQEDWASEEKGVTKKEREEAAECCGHGHAPDPNTDEINW